MAVSRVPLTIVVPTLDEELNLGACLDSVEALHCPIFIVDSHSSDETLRIARNYTDHIFQHSYESAPAQWNWSLLNLPFETPWVLALDADYQVSEELGRSILEEVTEESPFSGFYVAHRQIFMGRFIRHGGAYPRYRLSVFRRNVVTLDGHERVDNRFLVSGRITRLRGDIIEENRKESDLHFWIHKQLVYAVKAAEEEVERKSSRRRSMSLHLLREGRNERVLGLKMLWSRLPLYWRSVGYFIYRYIFRLGFLDGRQGFLYHFTQVLVFRIVLDAEVEKRRKTRGEGFASR